MIIWGGSGSDGFANTGGRYNPVTDSWLPTSMGTNVPAARVYHSAVWTGSEMIVWGGYLYLSSSGALNSGGRYDPSTDTWSITSTGLNVPFARTIHTAVWTGTEMIIWGGDPTTATGGIYCACPNGGMAFRDADADGFGNLAVSATTCTGTIPEGFVANSSDCNDGIVSVHPGATEVCNGTDDNCNGQIDEDDTAVDSDADGIHNACDNCRFTANPTQIDSDGDQFGNACDNCALVSNPNQSDIDSDQSGNACDNCPIDYNPLQRDFDVDHRGDVCDNCVFDFNPTQSDFDQEGQGDRCDLNDGLIYIFSTDRDYIEWQVETGPASWNVYEGNLGILRSSGTYAQAPGSNPLAHRACGVGQDYVEDFETPPIGAVKFSLVTGVTGGIEGSLGTNSAGATRPNANPCP